MELEEEEDVVDKDGLLGVGDGVDRFTIIPK